METLMSVISIVTLLFFLLFAILLGTKTINLDMTAFAPYLPVISALIMHFINQIDKNRRIKPKLKINQPKFLHLSQLPVEDSTISINVVNIGKSKVNLKHLIVLMEYPHKYLPFQKKRVKKEVIGRWGVPDKPIEPDSDISFSFNLANLYKQDGDFVKFGVKTSTGEIFWINRREFNKAIRKHITQYDNTIDTRFKNLYEKCPDGDIESDIVETLKSMADSSWDMNIIFQKTKEIFDSYQIYNIQWIGAVRDINSIEVRKLWQIDLNHGYYLRDIYTKLDESISVLFKSVALRTYNELRDNNIITIDVNEDQVLNELDIPYKVQHGDFESIFDELVFYLKPDEYSLDKQSDVWLTFGRILEKQYYFPSAINCYEKSIQLGNHTALLWLGIILDRLNDDINEIASLYTKYIDKNPDDYIGYYLLAKSYLKQCSRNDDDTYLSECSENINKALKLSQDNPEVYRLSAEHYTLIGKHELAKKQKAIEENLRKNEQT